jgi:hypothetical protein
MVQIDWVSLGTAWTIAFASQLQPLLLPSVPIQQLLCCNKKDSVPSALPTSQPFHCSQSEKKIYVIKTCTLCYVLHSRFSDLMTCNSFLPHFTQGHWTPCYPQPWTTPPLVWPRLPDFLLPAEIPRHAIQITALHCPSSLTPQNSLILNHTTDFWVTFVCGPALPWEISSLRERGWISFSWTEELPFNQRTYEGISSHRSSTTPTQH